MKSNSMTPLNQILDRNIENHKQEIKYLAKTPIINLKTTEQHNSNQHWINKSESKLKTTKKESKKSKHRSKDDLPERIFQMSLEPEYFPPSHNNVNKPVSQRVKLKSLDEDCTITNLRRSLPPLKGGKSQQNVDADQSFLSNRSVEKYSFTSPRYAVRTTKDISGFNTDFVPHYLLPRYRSRYVEMCKFRCEIIRDKDETEMQVLSGENLIEHLENRLQEKLYRLNSVGKTPNFVRLQIFAEIFDDLIEESWMLSPILLRIKSAYDNEVERILEQPIVYKDLMESEVDQLKRSIYHKEKLTNLQTESEQLKEAFQICVESGLEYDNLIVEEETRLEELIKVKEEEEERRRKKQINLEIISVIPTETEKLELLKAQCWDLMDDLSSIQKEIHSSMSSVATLNHLKDGLQDISIELEKLNYQKTLLSKDTDAMKAELQEFLRHSDMSQQNERLMTSLLTEDHPLAIGDYQEANKWNWYIS